MSVEFEPVRLRRRRRVDPLALASVAVLLGLSVALVKPWGDPTEPPPLAAAPSPVASGNLSGPHSTAIVAIPRVIRPGAAPTNASWTRLEPVLRRHEAWGVRAVLAEPGTGGRLSERWLAATPSDADEAPTVQLDPGDGSIVALGFTFPPSRTPLDVRFWQVTGAGLEWLDARAVDGVPSGGAFLYVRPGFGGSSPRPWTGGTYRLDALVGGRVLRLGLTIPDRFSNVPVPERPTLRDTGPLVPPTRALLTELPVGAFATVDGVAVPLDAEGGPALEEAGAWLDVDPGTGRPPRSWVATAYLPRATGLGLVLPARSVIVSASVERLAPGPLADEPVRVDPDVATGTTSPFALFSAPGGSAWSPGVYRLGARWTDVEGLHEGSWHVELRPGRPGATPSLLAAARAWARYAGTSGVLLAATARASDTGPDAIRAIKLRPAEAEYPAPSGVGCGASVIGERPAILGFTFAADRSALEVRARIQRPFLRRDDQVVMTASPGVPGLVLAAPARITTLPGADYVFTVQGSEGEALEYSLCLGMQLFDD